MDPRARLISEIPAPLEVGLGTSLYVAGEMVQPSSREPVALRLGSIEAPLLIPRLPAPGERGGGPGFVGFVDVPGRAERGRRELALVLEGGENVPLAEIELAESKKGPYASPNLGSADAEPLIAICMATWEPDPERLRAQIDSLRAQTWPNWVCVISDDASAPPALDAIREAIGGDERFVLSAAPERLGFYRNFERAIRLAPAEAGLIALCDQDDRWDPDKLEALAATLDASPGAALAYSDNRFRTEDRSGDLESAFTARRNSYDDIASLLVANTVTGAASLFRRELLEIALPFAGAPGQPYHDHWLALCALASGEIAYLDRPTYDRLRHPDSVTTKARAGRTAPPSLAERLRKRARRLRAGQARPGWRLFYFNRYLRIAAFARTLELRLGDRIEPAKRRVIRRLIDADTSALATLWLAARSLRPLLGRDETLGIERHLVGGLLWRRLAAGRPRRRQGR